MARSSRARFEVSGSVKQVLGDLPRQRAREIGLYLEAQIKIRCPVDTGLLRSSYHMEETANGVEVGTNVDYATYVENGTKYQHAQPHVRPALIATKKRFGKDHDIGKPG